MNRPDPGETFLVSGGGRGITAQCVLGLARRYRCRFILLGRTALEPEPAWAAECHDDAELKGRIAAQLQPVAEQITPHVIQRIFDGLRHSQQVKRTLEELAQVGASAEYISVDVCDAVALAASLGPVTERLGPVTGLIHGAGAISDKPIARKTLADFEIVYATKVLGLRNLLALVPPDTLRWLILFSSAAGFFGNAGQADYALANEALNRAAHRLKAASPGCRVVSLNWGPWDGGMVTPELSRRFHDVGIQVIPAAAGVNALVEWLEDSDAPTQVLVGKPWAQPLSAPSSQGPWTIRRRLSTRLAPCVLDHVIGQHPVLPAVCAAGWLANAGEQLYPGFRFSAASNLRVLKGVVFDANLAPEYVLRVEEQERGPGEIHYKGTVKSDLPKGRERFHYTGQCVLRRSLPPRPRIEAFDLSEDPNAVDGRSLYCEGRLFHGPTFQGIERVLNASSERITMRCRRPAVEPSVQGQFPVRTYNPYLADVQLQSVLVWALMLRGVGGHPLHLEAIELFAPPPFDETFYVTTHIRRADPSAIIGDSVMHDSSGWVYMRHLGAELTPSVAADGLLVSATA